MRILENFKSPDFWVKVFQLALVFFVIFVGMTLIISHFQAIFSGDFAKIYEDEWADGKWVNYFLIKIVISVVYAIYMTSRRKEFQSR
ncbi:MAG: hypothetical protein WBL27_00145 [Salinimicrobium sp.]